MIPVKEDLKKLFGEKAIEYFSKITKFVESCKEAGGDVKIDVNGPKCSFRIGGDKAVEIQLDVKNLKVYVRYTNVTLYSADLDKVTISDIYPEDIMSYESAKELREPPIATGISTYAKGPAKMLLIKSLDTFNIKKYIILPGGKIEEDEIHAVAIGNKAIFVEI